MIGLKNNGLPPRRMALYTIRRPLAQGVFCPLEYRGANMLERFYEIPSLSCQIRTIRESDLDGLLLVKPDASVHRKRLQQQKEGRAVYLGAFLHRQAVGYVLLSLENKEDVMPYTNHERCADMVDLLIIAPLRNCGVGTRLALACEEACVERGVPYLGLDVNPADNAAAKKLYERLGYHAVGGLHLDGVYAYTDGDGSRKEYEDWCIDMIKRL